MALLQRILNFTLANQNGQSFSVNGLRASCRINKAGSLANNLTEITIYGLSIDHMNNFSTFGLKLAQGTLFRNTITVEAGDSQNGTSIVFQGDIIYAYADLNSMPNVGFKIQAQTSGFDQLAKATPYSRNGEVKISQTMQDISGNLTSVTGTENTLQNDITIRNPYYAGSYLEQMRQAAQAAGIQANIDDGSLILSTPTTNRQGSMPMVSKDTGMIGSPTYNENGIFVRTLFNPQIKFQSLVQVQSSILSANSQASQFLPANGTWLVYAIDHLLETQTPNGKWESALQCSNPASGSGVSNG